MMEIIGEEKRREEEEAGLEGRYYKAAHSPDFVDRFGHMNEPFADWQE